MEGIGVLSLEELLVPSKVEGSFLSPEWLELAQVTKLKNKEYKRFYSPGYGVGIFRYFPIEKDIIYKPTGIKKLTAKSDLVVLSGNRYIIVNGFEVFIIQDDERKVEGIKDAVFSELKNAIERKRGVKVVSIQHAYPFELEIKLDKSLDIYEEREIRVLGKKIYAVFSNDSVFMKTEEVNKVIKVFVERNYKEVP